MQVYLAGAAALLGIVLLIAGVKGNGPHLFSAVTGVGVGSTAGSAPAVATGSGGVSTAPAPLGPTGPGMTGPVRVA